MKRSTLLAILILASASTSAQDDLSIALTDSKAKLGFRYRFEGVDQTNIDENAGASTLRTRFTWDSASYNNLTLGLEVDWVASIGRENYNSTNNGNTQYPVVADPTGADINQVFARYTGEEWEATGGRQRINHGTQRFIGGVAWRQNEQTFDSARIEFEPLANTHVDYAYVWNVERIFGPDGSANQPPNWRSNSHFLRGTWTAAENQNLEAFVYALDFENGNGIPNSSTTFGLGYTGRFGPLGVALSYATQSDNGDNPTTYDADYYLIQADYKLGPVTLGGATEVLGSDSGTKGFATPLATLHKFQGWADKFLVTPANGIEDVNVSLKGKIGPVALAAIYHEFSANEGGADYGNEINLIATWKVSTKTSVQFKFADYRADTFATDTTKGWLTLNFAI